MIAATQSKLTELANKPNQFTCICCRVKFDSLDLQKNHFKSEWHSYNLKRKVCHLEPIDSENFAKIQSALAKETPVRPTNSKNDARMFDRDHSEANEHDDEGDSNWDDVDEVDDQQLLDEDYDEQEAEEMLARVIQPGNCLFCDKKSQNTEASLVHMNLMHGFFIPEDQYMIDLDGMLEYLGFKVGAGATCLWCSKQFATTHGAKLHMLYKDHCKILYDQGRAIDEFKEFYDYSSQEQIPMKPLNELAIPKRRFHHRENERALARAKGMSGDSKQLVAKKNLAIIPGSYQAKNIKKFNAYRAKILLRTGMANNQTMRGRLRQQNPI